MSAPIRRPSSVHSFTFPAPLSTTGTPPTMHPAGESEGTTTNGPNAPSVQNNAAAPPQTAAQPQPQELLAHPRNRRPRFAAAAQPLDDADPTGEVVCTTPPNRVCDSPKTPKNAAPPSPPIEDEEDDAFVLNSADAPSPSPAPAPFIRLPEPALSDIGLQTPTDKVFSFNDDSLTWMNERPYNVLGFLGKGGFGIVHKVELLTPLGWTVKSDGSLPDPDFEGTKGFEGNSLERIMHSGSIDEEAYNPKEWGGRLNRSGFCFALKKMSPGAGSDHDSDWDDCLREVKLMRALKKVLFLSSSDVVRYSCIIDGWLVCPAGYVVVFVPSTQCFWFCASLVLVYMYMTLSVSQSLNNLSQSRSATSGGHRKKFRVVLVRASC